jgi:hypothetical protein
MDCWQCRKNAVGTCRFCGRGVCENHVATRPYILQLYQDPAVKALVVEDALYCGVCHPRPNPIELPDLDGRGVEYEDPPDE